MMGSDEETYLKMVAVWSITKIPDLKMELVGSSFKISCKFGFISGMDSGLFYRVEPIEIVQLIEGKFEEQFGQSGLQYRNTFKGFKKNPFSSQN
jgi:hypothetical protein